MTNPDTICRVAAYSNSLCVVSNAYDHQSRRILKVTPTATHSYLYDGWNLIQETISDQQSTTTNRYVWGNDLSGSLQGAGGVGGLLAVSIDGAWYFPFYDNNGNITAYANENGNVVAEYTYDAFGRTIAQSGPLADAFPHRFSTKYHDSETGLYYYGYRFYSLELMRWLNRDPIGDAAFLSQHSRQKTREERLRLWRKCLDPPYVFVFNSPVDRHDPFGLWPWSRYEEDGSSDGSTTITVKKGCTIVVLFGHGLSTKPHTFKFDKPCTAGGFVGCDAGSSNTKIREGNRMDDAKLTDGVLNLGGGSGSLPDENQFGYWLDKAKAGARSKAKTFCKNRSCCCKKVVIYGELAGSAWNPDNWSFPGGWEETVNCDEVQ